MSRETQLWYWLLFQSTVPTSRAKELLARCSDQEATLGDVFNALPREAARFGLNRQEVRKLQPPESLPDVNAIRWDEERYPQGLLRLPLKLRPALLFVEGSTALLERPIVTLPPAPLPDEERGTAQEALSLLLDESLLPAVVHGSDQAALLMTEMAHTAGHMLFFVRAGLDTVELEEEERALLAQERALLAQDRLLLVSPLPPGTSPNPKWDRVLSEVEAAMADRCVLTTAQPSVPQFLSNHPEIPTLWLHRGAGKARVPEQVEHADDPAALLVWLTEKTDAEEIAEPQSTVSLADAARPLGADAPADPPPTPEETLRILQKGGNVPPALRERLFGDSENSS